MAGTHYIGLEKKICPTLLFRPGFPAWRAEGEMRFTGMLLGMAGMAGLGMGAETCTVRVHVNNLFVAPPAALFQAKSVAREMFGRIGVQVQWQGTAARDTDAGCWPPVEIDLEAGLPEADRPDSMAYATPYAEGRARIHVFVARVASMVPANRMGILLGHVLVHEITHVLQGVSRHSGQGVMKAHWDIPDFRAMEVHPLPFDDLDVLLIHAGVRRSTVGEPLTSANE